MKFGWEGWRKDGHARLRAGLVWFQPLADSPIEFCRGPAPDEREADKVGEGGWKLWGGIWGGQMLTHAKTYTHDKNFEKVYERQ